MTARHDMRHYETRRSHRWTDRVGTKVGRLLYLKWIGTWRDVGWWLTRCDCGTEKILPFRPADYISCGCWRAELRKRRDLRTQLSDGTWGHPKARKVTLPDGRVFATVTALARHVGISPRAMLHRLDRWPQDKWLEPGQPRGLGVKTQGKRIRREWRQNWRPRRRQPWATANLKGGQ